MTIKATIIVKGKVQGVGYRDFVDRMATELNLTGFVRNLTDRSVEIVCEGEKEAIEKLLHLIDIKKYPIKVSQITADWSEPTGKFTEFNIIFEDVSKETFERLGLGAVYLQEIKHAVDSVGDKVSEVKKSVETLRTDTNQNFDKMDTKYDKISQTMIGIAEDLKKSNK